MEKFNLQILEKCLLMHVLQNNGQQNLAVNAKTSLKSVVQQPLTL